MSAATEKLLFTCAGCGYKARIPAHYAGRSIHCPQCKSVQAVPAVEEAGGSPAASAEAAPAPALGGKIVFACTSCTYKGRLSAEYDGKTIRCPGCQTPQVVKGTPFQSPIVASLSADEPVFKGMEGDKVRFVCGSCGYRARIPSKYAGKPIHCPQCRKVEVVKPEADMEDSTGKTVSISKISSVEVKEPRLAMTNVGVQFACAVCGFESRISPSCVGDAIYCPKCRSPQKVEWSDPAAAKPVAESAALEAKSSPVAAVEDDVPLPGFIDDEPKPMPVLPAARAPAAMPTPLPVAAPAAKASAPPMLGDITDIQAILSAPEEPKPAPVAMKTTKQGGRRVISAAPRSGEPAPSAPAPAPAVAPRVEAAPSSRVASGITPAAKDQPKRRSVATPAKPLSTDDEPDTEETAKAMPPSRARPADLTSSPATAPASKLPLIICAALAVLLLVFAGVLFMQTKSLSAKISNLETAQAKAEAETRKAQKDADAAVQAQPHPVRRRGARHTVRALRVPHQQESLRGTPSRGAGPPPG